MKNLLNLMRKQGNKPQNYCCAQLLSSSRYAKEELENECISRKYLPTQQEAKEENHQKQQN